MQSLAFSTLVLIPSIIFILITSGMSHYESTHFQGLIIVEDNSLPLLPPIKKPKRGRPNISRIQAIHED